MWQRRLIISRSDEVERLLQGAGILHPDERVQPRLFATVLPDDAVVKNFRCCGRTNTSRSRTYFWLTDSIGFTIVREEMFRHLVIASCISNEQVENRRLFASLSWHSYSRGYNLPFSRHPEQRAQRESRIYCLRTHRKTLGTISVVFYDMTTLYFDVEDEDDLRKIGFSKDGKFQNPQIMVGLLWSRRLSHRLRHF